MTHVFENRYSRINNWRAVTTERSRVCVIGRVCRPRTHTKPQNPKLWGANRRFQAKLAKSKNVHIIKTTATILLTKFCTVIKTTKCPSCVVQTHESQIHDSGRPPSWKNPKWPYLGRGSSDFDQIWRDAAVQPSWPLRPLKFELLKIQDGGGRHLEK